MSTRRLKIRLRIEIERTDYDDDTFTVRVRGVDPESTAEAELSEDLTFAEGSEDFIEELRSSGMVQDVVDQVLLRSYCG